MSHWTNPALLAAQRRGGPLTFRSKASAGGTGTTAATVAKPTGVVSSDFLVAIVWGFGFSAMSAPAGWSLAFSNYAATIRLAIFTKKATGSEPANYAFTPTGIGNRIATILAFSGGEGEVDVIGTKSAATSVTSVATTLNALTDGVLISTYCIGSSRTVGSPPSGMTQVDLLNPNISSATYILSPSPPGATGNKTLVWNGATNDVSAIALQIK